MNETPAENLDFDPDVDPEQARPWSLRRRNTPGAMAPGVAGERGISPIAVIYGRRGKGFALAGLACGCAILLAATWSHPKPSKPAVASDEPVKQVVDFAQVSPAHADTGAPQAGPTGTLPADAPANGSPPPTPTHNLSPGDPSGAPVVPAIGVASGLAQGSPTGDDPSAAARDTAQAAAQRLRAIHAAPLLAFSSHMTPQDASAASPVLIGEPPHDRSADGAGSELDQLRRGSAISLVRARRLPDRDLLLSAGAVLPCVLETALDSSAPGFVTCRIPRDISSDTGAVVLLEKGSRVIGEYQSGFTQGRARIFVLWTRITTPGGVAVDVDSPAADALGRGGFDGRIDSHFWQRFGGALLLTTVQGGLSAAATADARFASVGQAPNEAAATALQSSISITPTLTKPQGSEVAIFVSRDLDFASVYALRAR